MQPALKFRRPMPSAVGILGGMGPAAGADFARLFVDSCTDVMRAMGVAVTDQAYPEHWLAQVPIPDRSASLLLGSRGADAPLESMKQVAARLGALGARTLAIACNTAHAWHASLQRCACAGAEKNHRQKTDGRRKQDSVARLTVHGNTCCIPKLAKPEVYRYAVAPSASRPSARDQTKSL